MAIAADAAGSLVTLIDPSSNTGAGGAAARVTSGKLSVGDGAGNLTVDGTVVGRPAPLADYKRYHNIAAGTNFCTTLATAPAGKAIVLQSIGFGVYQNPSPSSSDYFKLFSTPDCTGIILTDVTPPGLGLITLPVEPGIISTTGFSILEVGDLAADVHAVGYLTSSAGLPVQATVTEGAPPAEKPGQ